MTQRLRALLASLCLLLVIPAFAQPTFNLQVINNAITGEIASPRIRVSGFTNVISAQFSICWNPQVLRFVSVSNLNLPNLRDSLHFSTSRIQEGILGFAWPSPNIITGSTVVDGTTIFRINFTVMGAPNSGTPLKFADKPPTVIEIGQVINGVIQEIPDSLVTFQNGFVAVGYTVPAVEPDREKIALTIAPNPFSEHTKIEFNVQQSAQVSWQIADATGRVLLKNKELLQPGQHGMEIASTQLHGTGAYFFILETAGSRIVRPIFYFNSP